MVMWSTLGNLTPWPTVMIGAPLEIVQELPPYEWRLSRHLTQFSRPLGMLKVCGSVWMRCSSQHYVIWLINSSLDITILSNGRKFFTSAKQLNNLFLMPAKPLPHSAETQPIPRPPLGPLPAAIHPLLAVSKTPSLIYDMSRHISSLHPSHPSLSPHRLAEQATEPPMTSLVIVCHHLPWQIDVRARQQNGYITVADVMDGLYRALRLNVTEGEYKLLPLSHDMKHQVNKAYEQRYRRASFVEYGYEKAQGLRRVDFLGGKNTFLGLSSTREGARVWRLNVSWTPWHCVSNLHLHRDYNVLTSLLSRKAIPSYPYTPSDSENCIKKKEILQFIIIIYYVQRSVAPLLTTPP